MRSFQPLLLVSLLACGASPAVVTNANTQSAPPPPPLKNVARFGAQHEVANYPIVFPAVGKEEVAKRVAAFQAKNPGFTSVLFGDDGFFRSAQLALPIPQDRSSITYPMLAATYGHVFDDNADLLGLGLPGIEVTGKPNEPRVAIQKWGKYQVGRMAIGWSGITHNETREFPATIYLNGHAWPGLPPLPAELSDHDLMAPLLALPIRVTVFYEVPQNPCDPVNSASDCPRAQTPPPGPPQQTRKLEPDEITLGRRVALFHHDDGASELRIIAEIAIRIRPPQAPPFGGEGLMAMADSSFEDGAAAPRWLDAVTGEDLSPTVYGEP